MKATVKLDWTIEPRLEHTGSRSLLANAASHPPAKPQSNSILGNILGVVYTAGRD